MLTSRPRRAMLVSDAVSRLSRGVGAPGSFAARPPQRKPRPQQFTTPTALSTNPTPSSVEAVRRELKGSRLPERPRRSLGDRRALPERRRQESWTRPRGGPARTRPQGERRRVAGGPAAAGCGSRALPGVAEGFTAPFGAPWCQRRSTWDFLAHLFPYAARRRGSGPPTREETTRRVLDADDLATPGSVENRKTPGTKRVTAIELIEDGLRLRARSSSRTPSRPTARRGSATEGDRSGTGEVAGDPRALGGVALAGPCLRRALESAYYHHFNRWRPRRNGRLT